MAKSIYTYFICILFCTLSFSSDYGTLYLMEFENSSYDYRTDNLRTLFPELIKENYSNKDFSIGYAPNLLNNKNTSSKTLKDGILLYGKYSTSYPNIIVSFDAYDVNTWEEMASRSYRCDMNDFECIQNAFLVCIEDDILPLFCGNYDCMGECGGSAVKDCSGVCGGYSVLDCSGTCNGDYFVNECGECVNAEFNSCVKDCSGDWGGEAYLNECNVCVGGNSGKEIDFGKDCFGVCGGTAEEDCNGVCNGEARTDCNGDCEGFAYFNECNVCVGGLTGHPIDLGNDCNGVCFGGDVVDLCGVCGGDNLSCSDCNGVPFGNAYEDECGVCDTDKTNDCKRDCNNQWGGEAFINECLVCVGGDTGLENDAGLDCSGDCWGSSKIDECGICDGLGAIYSCGCVEMDNGKCDCFGNILDCNGICGGTSVIDDCGVCGGDGGTCKDKLNNQNMSNGVIDISLNPLIDKINSNGLDIEKLPCIDCFNQPEINIVGEINNLRDNDLIKNNTDKFLYVVDELFQDAYNIFIKDIEVEKQNKQNVVKITVPVEYSVKKDLFETLLVDLAHTTKLNDNGTFIIEVLKDDVDLSQRLLDYFSLMKYQIVPVILFTDNNNEVKHIHVDSWNNDYNFRSIELNDKIGISTSNQFMPLFSITPSENSIQLNFDLQSRTSVYEFAFPMDEFNEINYSRLSLQFIYENALEGHVNSYAVRN